MTGLNMIGRNKQTMSLISSNYSLANILLDAAIIRRFVKFCKIGVLVPGTNASW